MGKTKKPVIYIVDDDDSVRRAMERLFRSTGMDVRIFASAQEFLKYKYREKNSCMIVDIKLGGKSGLELQDELRARGSKLPVSPGTIPRKPEIRQKNQGQPVILENPSMIRHFWTPFIGLWPNRFNEEKEEKNRSHSL